MTEPAIKSVNLGGDLKPFRLVMARCSRWLANFQRNLLLSVLKTDTAVYFETLVITNETGWRHNIEDHHLNYNHLENFKSRIYSKSIFLLMISLHILTLGARGSVVV